MGYQELIVKNLDRILDFWLLLDDKGNIIHCSEMIYRHLGYSEADIIDQPFQVLFPADDPGSSDYLYQLLFDSHFGSVVNQKTQIKQKNDVIIDIELSLYQLDNSQKLILIVFHNITEVVEIRKKVKSNIERLSQEFNLFDNRTIYESIQDFIDTILVSITAGQGLRFNRAFLFLVDSEEGILKGIQAIGPGSSEEAGKIYGTFNSAPKTLSKMIQYYKNTIGGNSSVNNILQGVQINLSDYQNILIKSLSSQNYILINDDYPLVNEPSVIWLRQLFQVHECAIIPMLWHGRSTGVIVVDNQVTRSRITTHDIKGITRYVETATNALESEKLMISLDKSITQVKQANLKIRESQEILIQREKLAVMGEMVAHMAHEVRGPLATIGGYASRVFKQMDDADTHYDSLSRIVETVRTLELVVNDILTQSLPKQDVSKGCDCTKSINKVLSMLEDEIHLRKVSVSLNIQGDLPEINIKEHHLFEIVNNLVKNALESIENDGLLLVLASSISNKVVITIQDTGPGIPAEIKDKIFSPFFTTKKDGTGLGLVVVKNLVEQYNGSIEVRTLLNKGTTFIISFPVEPQGVTHDR
ncbi:MAG: ATP-binding protein [bacterium]